MNMMNRISSITFYQIISTAFCLIAVISNIISTKMVHLPYLHAISMPAGLITYPVLFILTDLVTELFGPAKARFMVYLALAMNLLCLGIIQLVLILPSPNPEEQIAFQVVLGLSGWRIFSSLTAYSIAQIIDIRLYAWIKSRTGSRLLWLRNNGSTCIAQLVDTILVDLIYFYFGLEMAFAAIIPIMILSYTYKTCFNLVSTPLFYLMVYLSKRYVTQHSLSAEGEIDDSESGGQVLGNKTPERVRKKHPQLLGAQ